MSFQVHWGYGERELPRVAILHHGKTQGLTRRQSRCVQRSQVIEPIIGHVKVDCHMRRRQLKGAEGDALHALACAALD
ncbi:MAG: hypothetical protein ACYC97_03405 [Metallibacterium sp.]